MLPLSHASLILSLFLLNIECLLVIDVSLCSLMYSIVKILRIVSTEYIYGVFRKKKHQDGLQAVQDQSTLTHFASTAIFVNA